MAIFKLICSLLVHVLTSESVSTGGADDLPLAKQLRARGHGVMCTSKKYGSTRASFMIRGMVWQEGVLQS